MTFTSNNCESTSFRDLYKMVIYVRVQGRRPNFKSGSTTGVYGIFRKLKFEPDAEIGHKVPFRSLRLSAKVSFNYARQTPTIPIGAKLLTCNEKTA